MSMRVLMATLWLAASLLAGCGADEEGVVLEIRSDLLIPAEVDMLRVSAAAKADGRTLGEVERALTTGQAFPLSIALVPSTSTPEEIIIRVVARSGVTDVTDSELEVQWSRGRLLSATIYLYGSPQ